MQSNEISYTVEVETIDGKGKCTIEDTTLAHPGETPEECVRREAAEAGWRVVAVHRAEWLT